METKKNEVGSVKNVEVPVGMNLREIRENVPPGEQLRVMFVRTKIGREEDVSPIKFQIGSQEFEIPVGKDLYVGINPDRYGDLYLNPVQPDGMDHDVPGMVDQELSRSQVRSLLGNLKIVIRSDDLDLNRILDKVSSQRVDIALVQEYLDKRASFDLAQVSTELNALVEDTEMDDLDIGSNLIQIMLSQGDLAANEIFIQRKKEGGDPDLKEIWKTLMGNFVEELKRLSTTRMGEIRAFSNGLSEMVIAFDQIEWDKSNSDLNSGVLLIYREGRGWGVTVADANCPQHANAALRDIYDGNVKSDLTPVLARSVEDSLEKGELIVDKTKKLLVFKRADSINPYRAVFHGSEELIEAMQTIFLAADPVDGGRTFGQFVIGKNELVLEKGEPIVIRKEDLI